MLSLPAGAPKSGRWISVVSVGLIRPNGATFQPVGGTPQLRPIDLKSTSLPTERSTSESDTAACARLAPALAVLASGTVVSTSRLGNAVQREAGFSETRTPLAVACTRVT
jgi:hypothetical protein